MEEGNIQQNIKILKIVFFHLKGIFETSSLAMQKKERKKKKNPSRQKQ